VDAADCAGTFTALEEGILLGGTRHPTEAALHLRLVVSVLSVHDGLGDLYVFFPELFVRFVEDTVSGMATFLLACGNRLVNFHIITVGSITNFFDCEFYSSNFKNVLLLNFVVLHNKKLEPTLFDLRSFRYCV
jgi:hypothetical protein